jgi:hypothetical protein
VLPSQLEFVRYQKIRQNTTLDAQTNNDGAEISKLSGAQEFPPKASSEVRSILEKVGDGCRLTFNEGLQLAQASGVTLSSVLPYMVGARKEQCRRIDLWPMVVTSGR